MASGGAAMTSTSAEPGSCRRVAASDEEGPEPRRTSSVRASVGPFLAAFGAAVFPVGVELAALEMRRGCAPGVGLHSEARAPPAGMGFSTMMKLAPSPGPWLSTAMLPPICFT